MRQLKIVFRWYVDGSLHVSLALLAFLAYTSSLTGIAVSTGYYGLLGFSSVAGYNAIKYGAEPWKRKGMPASRTRVVLVLSGLALLAACACAFTVTWQTLLLFASGAAVAALYALPVLPGFRNFRSFGLIKVLLVALVWVHLTVWIPLWEAGAFTHWDFIVEATQRGLWVCMLMLPFEIRDMAVDPPELRTWPRRWGLPLTRTIGWTGACVFALMTLLKDEVAAPEFWSKAIAALFMGWAIQWSPKARSRYFASFWVESVPIGVLALWYVLRWVTAGALLPAAA